MSSSRRFWLRSLLLLGFSVAGTATPTAARADALDLVRSIASERAPARGPAAGKRPTRPARPRGQALRPSRPGVRATPPAPKLRLTAAQRGSGRIQVLDAGQASTHASALPTVERKSAGGFGPGFLAARAR